MKRMFYPSKPEKTNVKYWTYTKNKGLQVTYLDKISCKSGWTLKELLKANHTFGDGLPVIEKETAA